MANTDYIGYSPSAVDTFATCETRFWFDSHADGSGVMPTDNTAASVSRAIHDALMDYHRQLETLYTAGQSLDDETAIRRLNQLLDKHLRQKNMDRLDDPVAGRLTSASPGLSRAALLIRDGMKDWSIDPDDGQMLVWAEAPLYSESEVAGVELKPGFMSRTRPDIVGIRPSDNGTNRVLIRDYKARGSVVYPRFDTGVIVRAWWAMSEVMSPRCDWFVKGRNLALDETSIDVETVNLQFGDALEFTVSAVVPLKALAAERDRIVDTLEEMRAIDAADTADRAVPTPSGLCRNYCPHLHRCFAGQQHVQKRFGVAALQKRLAEVA